MTKEEPTILIVDDDKIDRRAIRRILKKENFPNPIVEAKNGQEALQMIRGDQESSSPQIKKPYLILLDLNMPVLDGFEFLDELRNDKSHGDAVVFVLTTSNDEMDKKKAYSRNISGYLLKREIGEEFRKRIQMLRSFIQSVEFPG